MTRAFGIDVSYGDDAPSTPQHVDFAKAKAAGAQFVYTKASQLSEDVTFQVNWANAKTAGLPRGAYHYLDWRTNELAQAEMFCSLLKDDPGELPPCLDLEMNPEPYNLSASLVSGKAWNFLTHVEKMTGKTPLIYVGYFYWNSWGSNNAGWARFPLWLPWYASEVAIKLRTLGTGAPKPWKDWAIWQYTDRGDGSYYGCESKQVDLNWFNGTLDDLNKFTGGAPVSPVVVPPVVSPKYPEYVTTTGVNVRAGPSVTDKLMQVIPSGVVVQVISPSTTNGYLQIVGGGWVFSTYLKAKNPIS